MPAVRTGRRLTKLSASAAPASAAPEPAGTPGHLVQFSATPLCSIDIAALTNSKFLLQKERLLPYRDESGAVNIHLVNLALEQATSGEVEAAAHVPKLKAWARHAARTLGGPTIAPATPARGEKRRAEDEQLTLDELVARQQAAAMTVSRAVGNHRRRVAAPPETRAAGEPVRRRLLRSRLREVAADEAASERGEASGGGEDESSRAPSDGAGGGAEGAPSEAGSGSESDDRYEVQEILREALRGGRPVFLLRWYGYSAEHDSWEAEEDVAAELVAAFRQKRRLAASCAGSDQGSGRTRKLWCSRCGAHEPADNFSAAQKRAGPATRQCLAHSMR